MIKNRLRAYETVSVSRIGNPPIRKLHFLLRIAYAICLGQGLVEPAVRVYAAGSSPRLAEVCRFFNIAHETRTGGHSRVQTVIYCLYDVYTARMQQGIAPVRVPTALATLQSPEPRAPLCEKMACPTRSPRPRCLRGARSRARPSGDGLTPRLQAR